MQAALRLPSSENIDTNPLLAPIIEKTLTKLRNTAVLWDNEGAH